MKKFSKAILSGVILSSGLLFGAADAFAMDSKGDIDFSTDANTYYRSATSIDVSGYMPFDGGVVELYSKDESVYRDITVEQGGYFEVSFSTRDLPTGLYDVKAVSEWGKETRRGELTNYIKVNY